jgi:hypothetical protein
MRRQLYEASYRNLTLAQAQAMYRIAVNLNDYEPMIGSEGSSWSGVIPGRRDISSERTITIEPMIDNLTYDDGM